MTHRRRHMLGAGLHFVGIGKVCFLRSRVSANKLVSLQFSGSWYRGIGLRRAVRLSNARSSAPGLWQHAAFDCGHRSGPIRHLRITIDEGRVAYAPLTLTGLSLYFIGAIRVTVGPGAVLHQPFDCPFVAGTNLLPSGPE